MPARRYPFPFVGAGLASYFEYCFIDIKFKDRPSAGQIRRIKESIPPPLFIPDEVVTGRILFTRTDQFINGEIEKIYGKNRDGEDIEEGDGTPVSSPKFEQAIEQWLKRSHKISPIEVVFRREDEDIGGTKVSDWHRDSVDCIDQLFKKWATESADDYEDEELEAFIYIMKGLMEYREVDSEEIRRRFLIDQHVYNLMISKNTRELVRFLSPLIVGEKRYIRITWGIFRYLKTENFDREVFVSAIRSLIDHPQFSYHLIYLNTDFNHLTVIAILERKDFELLEKFKHLFRSPALDAARNPGITRLYVERIYVYGHNVLQSQKRWEILTGLYDFLMDVIEGQGEKVKVTDLSFYCNALWVLQQDNTGLSVNRKLNEKFLQICLPIGEDNPAIFFNAGCLYNEMDEFEKAIECLNSALDFGIKGAELQALVIEVTSAAIFKNLRQHPLAKPLLEKLNGLA